MRKLEFLQLELTNFKCFVGGPHVLPLGTLGPGVHFVRGRNEAEPRLGPNGAGKSSIFDAICWCIYGRTADGGRNPDIRPWYGKGKVTTVILKVKINGKKQYITRTANPNMLTIGGPKDERQIGQEQIDELIGLSFEAATNTILLGQEQPLFLDRKPREKMELFSDVLNLERWERRSEAAGKRARELEMQHSMLDGVLAGQQAALEELIVLRDKVKAQSVHWRAEVGDQQRASETELKDVKRRLAHAEAKQAELDPKLDWTMVEIKGMNEDYERLRDDAAGAKSLRAAKQKLVSKLDSEDLRVCPACGREFDAKSQGRHRSEISKEIGEITAALRKVVKAEKSADLLRDKIAVYTADASSLAAELSALLKTIANLRARRDAIEQTMQRKEEEANPYHAQLQDIRKRVSKVTAEVEDTKVVMAKLNRRLERTKYWVKGFKDVRLFLIEEVLQELQLATNAALEDVGLIGWEVEYDVEKETKAGTMQRGLNVLIKSPKVQQRVRWENWSGGEKQRLRIVGALALSEVLLNHAGVQSSLEILDEPAHFMAPDGVRDITDYLAWRAQGLDRQTFYVDHLAIESSRFASVHTIVRTNEGSRIE